MISWCSTLPIRFNIGLGDTRELISDLEQARAGLTGPETKSAGGYLCAVDFAHTASPNRGGDFVWPQPGPFSYGHDRAEL